ncbi:MAG: homocysteine S-methyltransferase family protein [Pseudomonadota bacterium]
MSYLEIITKLDDGGVVVLDGGIGTELERLGVPMHGDIWCGHALESDPEKVAEVHRLYVAAGADVITANTYCLGRQALDLAGMGHKTTEWNVRAMAIADGVRQEVAQDRTLAVAGSVAPFGVWNRMPAEELAPHMAEQAKILAGEGADFINLELLAASPDQARATVEACLGAGLPLWVSLSCLRNEATGAIDHGVRESAGDNHQRDDGPFADVARSVMAMGGDVLCAMHSELTVMEDAVRTLRPAWDGPLGAYPNAGYWIRPDWQFIDQVEPSAYAIEAGKWIDAGAQIVGGCCGVGPDQIAAVARTVADRAA